MQPIKNGQKSKQTCQQERYRGKQHNKKLLKIIFIQEFRDYNLKQQGDTTAYLTW